MADRTIKQLTEIPVGDLEARDFIPAWDESAATTKKLQATSLAKASDVPSSFADLSGQVADSQIPDGISRDSVRRDRRGEDCAGPEPRRPRIRRA